MEKKTKITKFTLRAYHLIINEKNEILLSDEVFKESKIVKFPGGGVEFGEGIIDCLKREALEEFGQEIEVLEHFYTTDFFQKAMFWDDLQVVNVYYLSKFVEKIKFRVSTKKFDFPGTIEENQSFRFVKIDELSENDFIFAIEKKVVNLLKKK